MIDPDHIFIGNIRILCGNCDEFIPLELIKDDKCDNCGAQMPTN